LFQHTERGEITVRVFLKKIAVTTEGDENWEDGTLIEKDGIRFEVRDTGKGLAGIDTELLFEPFSQGKVVAPSPPSPEIVTADILRNISSFERTRASRNSQSWYARRQR
jgi:hypothetical protein